MKTRKEVEEFILSMPNSRLDYPFGEGVAVYKVAVGDEEKMFALMPEDKTPINLSLKCDPTLAVLLREKYETVLEGYHLNKKHWNTLLLTGQLSEEEIKDQIVHSYNLVIGTKGHVPTAK
ncbi:MAG: MmcQ/YjbR family DNA-binding protein [Candidatus Saccharibacteria bacterium]|nr:MmcQ/YjbR family DNA-binding protein [Candidatus Saccharibacteria bacterium]